MIIAWILGLISSVLVILLLKETRDYKDEYILRVWNLALLIIGSLIPIVNIFMSVVLITIWCINTNDDLWESKEDSLLVRLLEFLNKPIK